METSNITKLHKIILPSYKPERNKDGEIPYCRKGDLIKKVQARI
jgi:hypothetical protein